MSRIENLKFKTGKLVGVVGDIGSGKSSLFSAILGEIPQLNGEVIRGKNIAYVAQVLPLSSLLTLKATLGGKSYSERKHFVWL